MVQVRTIACALVALAFLGLATVASTSVEGAMAEAPVTSRPVASTPTLFTFNRGSSASKAKSAGERLVEELRERARDEGSEAGACWGGVFDQLRVAGGDCSTLRGDAQLKLKFSLGFTSCYLSMTGRDPLPEPCPRWNTGEAGVVGSGGLKECTAAMSPAVFGVYTQFYNHADNICFFLHSEIWQREADQAVDALLSSSSAVAAALDASRAAQEVGFWRVGLVWFGPSN